MTTTVSIPSDEGTFSPREADALTRAQSLETNRADDEKVAAQAFSVAKSIYSECSERMTPLWRQWRAINFLLAGNTLDKGGPEDVHIPEIYKSMETIVPRLEERIVEHPVWFRIVARKLREQHQADTMAAYYDFLFDQAKVRDLIQPAIRSMLVTQAGIFYAYWDNHKSIRNVRTIERTFNAEGRLERKVKTERKEVIDYSGPRVKLVDPFDFIIHPKATTPQDALYVGHRVFMTKDEIQRIGVQMNWKNLDKLDEGPNEQFGLAQDFYSQSRSPVNRYQLAAGQELHAQSGRPAKIEVLILYTMMSLDDGETYDDYRIVVSAGKTVHDVTVNPHDGQFRPYATMCSTRTGLEFYNIGVYDNAIRLNQHIDRLQQTTLRGASLAGQPLVFAEEDSDLPDSLYTARPLQVYKGVGPVRFTTLPDSFLRSMPLVIAGVKRDLEEVTGSFRLNMGQDSQGTATEANLSLIEGNRRTSGLVRAVGGGLEQLLILFHRLSLQHSSEEIEFPVLGKRALDLRKTHVQNFGPADLLDDVKFELVGLRNLRNQGMKATGLQAAVNATTPFIMANPANVDQVALLHDFFTELVGPDEADRYIKIPTPLERLHSQEEENSGLLTGTEIEVDPEDDHKNHQGELYPLYKRALDPNDPMPFEVRRVVIQHWVNHDQLRLQQEAQQQVVEKRQALQRQILPPEAGGQQTAQGQGASPQRGGFSDAIMQLANEPSLPGQTPNENPGPADSRKYSRSGGTRRTTNQRENMLSA